MNTKQINFFWATFFFLNLCFLVGCSTLSPQPSSTVEILPVTTTIPHTSTSVLPTLSLTQMPLVTPTFVIPPIPTSTSLPTMTAIPTPPNVENEQEILWLLETNNGCQLPCWWGITPGQTEWTTAKQFLNRYDVEIYHSSSTSGATYYETTIPLSLELFSETQTGLGIGVKNGIVQLISIHFHLVTTPPGSFTHYYLSEFLTMYGPPTEVWVSTYSSYHELPFLVVLFYPDKGIVVSYGVIGVKQGGVVRGCLQQEPINTFRLWNPLLGLTFDQLKTGSLNVDYLSLLESTGMDVMTFYDTFKNSDNQACLETPADLWP